MAKKLIEVSLPLDAINAESAREKSIRHGHPSTLHLWWSRKPLATARAVIFASLVDDPSSHPDQFPTKEEQTLERERLHGIIQELVRWENLNDKNLLKRAYAEIKKSIGEVPALFDPFAGGGSIPLEAQRLGLEAHAADLNPVAVMINKAMIEIPPRFAGRAPVNPDAANMTASWEGAAGLAEDVRYYGEKIRKEAYLRIGHLYPKIKDELGRERTIIAWKWARTVKCPNPACGCKTPLTSGFALSKKHGKEVYARPIIENEKIRYEIGHGPDAPKAPKTGRGKFCCVACGAVIDDTYIKNEAMDGRMGIDMMAVIAEGDNGRIYLAPDEEQISISKTDLPPSYPEGAMPNNPRWFSPPIYGYKDYYQIFTNRQLTMLTTFSELVNKAARWAESDALSGGIEMGVSLSDGGDGARAYGEAIAVYLAFGIDRLANRSSTICVWNTIGEKIEQTFARQAIPMSWDFAEGNPFSNSTGSWSGSLGWIPDVLRFLPNTSSLGYADQADAQVGVNNLSKVMISTDPPYYDNIGYADLSDYFYIWLRLSLRHIYPELFSTRLVPKADELVATPYRFPGGADEAKEFFENGMSAALSHIYESARDDIPVTIYYAFKQNEIDADGRSSKGWETILSAIIKSGFTITGTWPIRSERPTGLKAYINSLASSIVLVCRKRNENAPACTRSDFVKALRRELTPALQKLQESNIAPVDLAQSAIGPGIAVFSRYQKVLEADGSAMSVRTALQIINQELDHYFSGQDSNIDGDSRFCIELFSMNAYNIMKFGEADILAKAKGASISRLTEHNAVYAGKGEVRLLMREELPEKVELDKCGVWMLTQLLARAMGTGGIEACAAIIAAIAHGSLVEEARNLAYRLYSICERRNWAEEGRAYNSLVCEWPKIRERAADLQASRPVQSNLFE